MSNQHPTPDHPLTPEESVSATAAQPQAQQEEFDWERGLEQLREKRQTPPADAAHADVRIAAAEPARRSPAEPQQAADKRALDAVAREKVLREYLQQWQQEHNDAFSEEEITGAETDTTVLLQEDWLSAQNALRTAADEHVLASHTVWLNPKRQQAAVQQQEEDGETAYAEEEASEEALPLSPEQLPVTVQVIDPRVNPALPVMCLSEKELMERLTRRLRPHLTDAVAGMVRVAVQKQAAALTYQLQQNLNEQTPALVDEILEYNLKAVMSEIRYDLKFKRNK
ncbi:MAG: hypothetical protein Q4G28_05195 [Neisseria sp.]|nr:hypothetical protein [Neisseria sp.]